MENRIKPSGHCYAMFSGAHTVDFTSVGKPSRPGFRMLQKIQHREFDQVQVQEVPDIGGGPTGEDALRDTILDVLATVLNFMALVAVVVIVIAGIRLVVAGAEDQQREKAKKMIIYTIVGLIIIILASAIVSFVADTLSG